MLMDSGFRGASRIGTPHNMRRLRIHGFGAYFGEDVPSSGYYDVAAGPVYQPPPAQTFDWGSTVQGIGSAIGSTLTGIGNVYRSTQQTTTPQYDPRTYQTGYGSGGQAPSGDFGDRAILFGGAALLIGVVLLSRK